MSSTWFEERRKNQAAEAEERRRNREFEARLQRDERRKDNEEKKQEKAQRRREKAQRKQARAVRREKQLTPGNVYRKGTLALVALSALASLPAQILHFVGIHWMLFPVGPSLEGAAWVMFAGVAYADERRLPVWVRWLLRALSLSAAGFAAHINYQYGLSLTGHGASADNAQAAGLGLAAVTLGGPLFFEVRQWVMTLSASTLSPKEKAAAKARRKHEKGRSEAFPAVAKRQEQLMLAAPFGTLKAEDAFIQAWGDVYGAPVGVTEEAMRTRLAAEGRVANVLAEVEQTPEQLAVERLLADIFGSPGSDGGDPGGTPRTGPGKGPRGGGSETATALGGKGKGRIRGKAAREPEKPLAEADLDTVRKLAEALGGVGRLSARNVREAVGCRNEYAVRLRDAVRNEHGEKR